MKEIELKKASGGRYRLNDIKIEEHEEETIKLWYYMVSTSRLLGQLILPG